ncbi:MAG: NfeD family protein [Defluviitaleaceae bacterium]|nr:NfeD family protein [Defluviitaleaceae bacterium]
MEPMTIIIILLVVGIVLLLTDIFLTETIVFGAIGVAALAVAAVMLALNGRWYFSILLVGLVAAGFVFFFKRASKHGLFKKLVMDDVDKVPSCGIVDLSTYSGKIGTALTPMRPIGVVDFGGVKVEAVSCGGEFLDTGTSVVVAETVDNKLFVRRHKDGEPVPN